MSETVWVVTIETKHGSSVSVHRTEQGATDALAAYAEEWWGDTGIVDIPSDDQVAIETYFDHVTDEFYSLESAEIQP